MRKARRRNYLVEVNGYLLREIREYLNLSCRQVSRDLNISPNTISNVENGSSSANKVILLHEYYLNTIMNKVRL